MNKKEIKNITAEEAENLTYSLIEKGKYKPLGLFIYKRSPNDFNAYDNATGCCWSNNFFSREAAVEWLLCDVEKMETQRLMSYVLLNLSRKINSD